MSESVHGFAVPFSFPVYFTRDAWADDNHVFLNAIRRCEPHRRHRVLVVVDARVADSHASLVADIQSYFSAFRESLYLVAQPVVVPGGEAVKNDLQHPLSLLGRINDVGLDRQSFLAVIGG